MAIFRRSNEAGPSSRAAIDAFWGWWAEARPRFEATLADGLSPDLVEELTAQVTAIDSGLACQLGGGPDLTLTGEGAAALRGVTERWRLSAPTGDGWSYYPARQRAPEILKETINYEGHELDLSHLSVGLRVDSELARVNVSTYHPDFLFLPEEPQLAISMQALSWALGEDDTVRWIGEVTPITEPPLDPLPPDMLAAVVEQVAEPFRGGAWGTGEGRTARGHAAHFRVRFPLHRPDFPLCEVHAVLSLPYQRSNPERLPVEPSSGALKKFEAELVASLGQDAVLAVVETGDDHRSFHLFVDPEAGALPRIDQLAAGWAEGRATVESEPDPGWTYLLPFFPR